MRPIRDMLAVHPGRKDRVTSSCLMKRWVSRAVSEIFMLLQLQGGLQNPVASAAIRRQPIPQPWRAAKARQLSAAMTALEASGTPVGSPCSSPGLASLTNKNRRMAVACPQAAGRMQGSVEGGAGVQAARLRAMVTAECCRGWASLMGVCCGLTSAVASCNDTALCCDV